MPSKRSKKCSYISNEDNTFIRSENHFLRKKNEDLAKALSETKIEHQKVVQSNLELHERLYWKDEQGNKLNEFIKTISTDVQMHIQQFLSLTEQMTSMLNKVNIVIQSPQALNHFIANSSSSDNNTTNNQNSKTMAVMPMVSGHTILSPKINLPRVTVKQLTDLMNGSHDNAVANSNHVETDEIEFADNDSSNNEDFSENDSDTTDEPPRNRLETMQEETEDEDEQSGISSTPYLSGVFKDIRVYISPMANKPVIQFKSKTPRFDRKSVNKSNNSLSARSPQCNSNGSLTLTQRSNDSSRFYSSEECQSNITQAKDIKKYQNLGISQSSRTIAEDYDPMEGPSNMQGDDDSFRPAPKETSTPYVPETRAEKTSYSSSEEHTTPIKRNITKRRGKTRTLSSNLSNCIVKIQKLSPNTMKSYTQLSPSRVSAGNSKPRIDSPTVLERSRRSSSEISNQTRKRSSSESSHFSSASPKCRRVRRNVKPVVYKEPSLIIKMRR